MKIRELLQKELWSKRTSRKILLGVGIIVVVLVTLKVLDQQWITPIERKSAKAALTQIDALQSFNSMSDAEFDSTALRARGQVGEAEHKALTSRDKWIAFLLEAYLDETNTARSDQRRTLPVGHPEWEREKTQSLQASKMVRDFVGQVLHKALEQ